MGSDSVVESSSELSFRILGSLEVQHGAAERTPTPPKQRVLLALLLYHANQVVSPLEITEALWDGRPPSSATAALHGYVTALRRTLIPSPPRLCRNARRHPILQTHPGGYVLRLAPHQLDLGRVRAFAGRARSRLADGHCQAAADLFHQALSCWSGPAFSDVRASGVLAHYAARLDEDRLGLVEERIGTELCLGRAPSLVGELKELCAFNPLHEGLHQSLMRVLHLTDRSAEALQVYTHLRRRLVTEIGIEPGPALRAVQHAILDGGSLPAGPHATCRGHRAGRTSQAQRRW